MAINLELKVKKERCYIFVRALIAVILLKDKANILFVYAFKFN